MNWLARFWYQDLPNEMQRKMCYLMHITQRKRMAHTIRALCRAHLSVYGKPATTHDILWELIRIRG